MATFVGREHELKLLNSLLDKETASLVVVYGRRRIGKSRLVEEFGRKKTVLSFSGLPPQAQTSVDSQLDEFYSQMKQQLPVSKLGFNDWGEAFSELATHTQKKKMILFFDEINWIGNKDPDFLGRFKNAWDMQFKRNHQLIVVLCGSVSPWINKNILTNTGFYGRISLKLQLKELSLKDCSHFLGGKDGLLSAHDQLKILSVTGGIPKYLEEVSPKVSAEENIKRLCFLPSGLLFSDFDYIFSALLQRESKLYEQIVLLLKERSLTQREMVHSLALKSGGVLSSLLEELVVSGFVSRDCSWHLHNGEVAASSKYRLSDNYLRFYLKYIKPNVAKIEHQQFQEHSLHAMPGWYAMMGLQVENLVLNNRDLLKKELGIYPDEVVYDNPFFQKKTARQKGCQIDYMVQTKFGNLYLCEIKFSRNVIRSVVIDEVKEKIARMSKPKNLSIRPVLIHASEVSDSVIDSGFFANIINLGDLLRA